MQEEKGASAPLGKGVRAGARIGPAERVALANDFERIYREGRRAGDGVLLVVVARNGLGHPRLAVAVGKKAGGKAHDRNRLRRLYREAFRLEKAALPAVDMIVSPARGQGGAPKKPGKQAPGETRARRRAGPDLAHVRKSLIALVAKTAAQLARTPNSREPPS
ncbi:ribonuclease P protein component [bacterium]|nr:ribonuclease P protein component [bacterium]